MTSKEAETEIVKFLDTAGVEVEKVEDEILEAREEVIKTQTVTEEDAKKLFVAEKVQPSLLSRTDRIKNNRVLVANLRQNDDAHNRTCALCLKRKPIDDFLRLKTSQVCNDCEE